MFFTVAIGVAVLAGLGVGSSMIMNVKEKQEVLLESFGKYVKTVSSPGLKLKKPWPFQNIATRVSTAIIEDKEDLKTKTKDDIFVTLPIKMHLQIFDSKKYNYESFDPIQQVKSRIAATVKQLTAQMDFADLYNARETISDEVRQKVGKEIEGLYGVKLIDVIVDEPHAPQSIQDSYNNVKASERDRQAEQNKAEAEKTRIITQAQARKEALRLDGEGIAIQRKAIFENYAEQFNQLAQKGLTQEQAHQVITIAMANDTIRDAASKGNVILTTTNASDVISQMAAISKGLKEPTSIKPQQDKGAAATHG